MRPFTRPDSASLNDMLTDAAVARLAEGGAELLTLQSVAAWLGLTRQALSQRLDDPNGPRRRMIQLIVLTFGERWLTWVGPGPIHGDLDRPPVRLPATPDEIHAVRVWTALTELARSEAARGNPHPLTALTRVRDEERALVRRLVIPVTRTMISASDLHACWPWSKGCGSP